MDKKVVLSLDYGTHGANGEYNMEREKENLKIRINELIDLNPKRIAFLFEDEKGCGIVTCNPA